MSPTSVGINGGSTGAESLKAVLHGAGTGLIKSAGASVACGTGATFVHAGGVICCTITAPDRLGTDGSVTLMVPAELNASVWELPAASDRGCGTDAIPPAAENTSVTGDTELLLYSTGEPTGTTITGGLSAVSVISTL